MASIFNKGGQNYTSSSGSSPTHAASGDTSQKSGFISNILGGLVKSSSSENVSTPKQYGHRSMGNGDTYTGETMFECDFTSIEQADTLLVDCKDFLSQAKEDLKVMPFSPFLNLKKWRQQQRDSKIMSQYNLITPRIKSSEAALRNLLGEVYEKKDALRMQANFLQVRLDSCIDYNKYMLDESNKPVEKIKQMIDKLSEQSATVKSMMSFNHEVLRLKNVEAVSKGRTFISWSSRNAISKPMSDAELAQDPDHPTLVMYLSSLRELREKYFKHLTNLLETREIYTSNLNNCKQSKIKLNETFKKENSSKKYTDQVFEKFDHKDCHDCLCCYSLTNECTNHLATLQDQAQFANNRLADLVEIREQLNEICHSDYADRSSDNSEEPLGSPSGNSSAADQTSSSKDDSSSTSNSPTSEDN